MAKAHESVDAYVAAQPAAARPVLERVRATIRKALPGATEGISYQIPVYKLDGRMVLYFAGFQSHYSIYPATARVVDALGEELAARLHSKASIHFSYGEAVPARLITRIARLRAGEAAEAESARVAKRKAPKKASTTASRKASTRASRNAKPRAR